jgi:Caspase domain
MKNNCALIIGIEDYGAYDCDAGNPEGTSDLSWAVNDALTYMRQCLALGMSPERICVLTSPALPSAALGAAADGVLHGPANRAGILDGLRWLSDTLSEDAPMSGLLVFSGHGEWMHGVEICPSDTAGALDEIICLEQVRQALGTHALDDLHILFDACHVHIGCTRAQCLRERMSQHAACADVDMTRSHEHILASCDRDQSAVATCLDGKLTSAFTWAITSVLRQCHVVEDHGVLRLDESYAELLWRAQRLLRARSIAQVPVLAGPADTAFLRFLQPCTRSHALLHA